LADGRRLLHSSVPVKAPLVCLYQSSVLCISIVGADGPYF